ncbi:MAG: sortase [bacterium]|nr:sortase [bacterium]
MNKHQFRAVLVAILAVCTSLVLWTRVITHLPLPQISEEFVTQFDDFLRSFSTTPDQQAYVEVKVVTVEDLGEHFASSVNETQIRASVIENVQVEVEEQKEVEESVEIEEIREAEFVEESGEIGGDVIEDIPVVHHSASELDQWDISRAWSIVIPSLGIRAPVLLPSMKNWSSRAWDMLEEQMQVGLNHGAVAYPHSSGPGRKGNLIIAGHSSPPTESARNSEFGSLFSKLPTINIGEEISIVTNGSPVRYRVEEKTIVSPQTTSILEQQYDESILKLITCFPVGTTRDRMIILAKKIEE